jgi:alkylation response protein AidB-like acyl-CoA dehydrogenase
MQFTFSEEQRMMAQALRALLDDVCTGADLRQTLNSAQGGAQSPVSPSRWQRLSELGLPGALAPESVGGLGCVETDFVLLAEEAGRAALPEPLIEHAGVAVPLLLDVQAAATADAGGIASVLAQAAVGECCLVFASPGTSYVHGLDHCHWLLTADHDHSLRLLSRADFQIAAQPGVDPLRMLAEARCAPNAGRALASDSIAATAWRQARWRAAVFAGAEALGVAQRLVDLAVVYANERKQFGKVIGSNQAIKHQLATVQIRIEFARPVVYAAAAGLAAWRTQGGNPESSARLESRVIHAKLAACDAADLAARTAIQVHGAMGYSWELDLQFYAKRAWALYAMHGDRNQLMRRLQESLFAGGLPLGTDRLFD